MTIGGGDLKFYFKNACVWTILLISRFLFFDKYLCGLGNASCVYALASEQAERGVLIS